MEENTEKGSFGYGKTKCKLMLYFGMPSSGLYVLFTLSGVYETNAQNKNLLMRPVKRKTYILAHLK